jgi:hypothetical protein
MSKDTTGHVSGKPPKPYDDFPLFPNAVGQWAKKIKGRMVYFGPWADPEEALQNYLDWRGDLYAGRAPRAGRQEMTVRELVNRFLTQVFSLPGRHGNDQASEDRQGQTRPQEGSRPPEGLVVLRLAAYVPDRGGRRPRSQRHHGHHGTCAACERQPPSPTGNPEKNSSVTRRISLVRA